MQCLSKHSQGRSHRETRFIELSLDLSLKIYIFGMGYIDASPFQLEWHLEVEKCLFLSLIQFGLIIWLGLIVRLGGFGNHYMLGKVGTPITPWS